MCSAATFSGDVLRISNEEACAWSVELRDPPPRVHATDLQLTTQLPPRYDTFEAFMPAVEEVWAATWARLQAGEPEAEEESPLSPR